MTQSTFLVINVSRIGDTLFATPAVRAIAAAHPGCHITALAHPQRAEVIEHLPFVARVGGISKRTAFIRGRLARQRYDYAFIYGFDEPLIAYGLRVAQRVVAFRQASDALNRRLYRCVELPPFQSEHAVPQRLRLPAALGIAPAGLRLAYQVAPSEAAAARARLAAAVRRESAPLIGVQVASFHTKAYRDWPIESFAELAQRILDDWPRAHFLIYGGSDERMRTTWLARRLAHRATDYAGRLTLRETAALMSLTQLYIGVDTGPTHIMSTFDVPLVGLYHCGSPSNLTGPLDHPYFYPVEHPRPFGCGADVPMAEISVDTVYDAVRCALSGQAQRAATL